MRATVVALFAIATLWSGAVRGQLSMDLSCRAEVLTLRHRVTELEVNLDLALLARQQDSVLARARALSMAQALERQILAENLVFASGGDPATDRWDWASMTLVRKREVTR